MNRTIGLTTIHALNWYGYQDTISTQGNLLLAGVTGSGKSILMDLIQFVLVGDQRLLRFNQSATGDRSDRTLKGYCLGDTKEEDNGVVQYMRQSVITYVALEFRWPDGKKVETWGLRVEFGSAAETQGKITPFFVPASLSRSDFLSPDKKPLDYTAFKTFIESGEGRIYAEGIESYLRDMAQPVHLNFDRNILRSLLPTAMSFTFLRSFNEFSRQFILPADKLDVSDVTASYRTFLGYERDLKDLNDQFARLKSICDTFIRLSELRRNQALSRYLEAELRHAHAAEVLNDDEAKLAQLEQESAVEAARLKALDETIPELQTRINRIKAAVNETPEGRLFSELKSQNEILSRQISNLAGIGTTLEQALKNRIRNAHAWVTDLRALPLEIDESVVSLLERAIHSVEHGGVANASNTLTKLSDAAKGAAVEANRAVKPQLDELAATRRQLGQLRDEIGALKIGKLPFPTRLLDALNENLAPNGKDLPARHLRELCEITDERWRQAIETAFTRKFAIVVAAEHYKQAVKIFHGLKASELGNDTGREALVNPARALRLGKSASPGSLAEKMRTTHPVAEAIVNQLFGDLICVESPAQLSALPPDQNGILPDGFMARGAFVERRRFYDGNPFVGKRGLEQQLAWKQSQVAELEVKERRLLPSELAVKALNQNLSERFDLPPSLYQDLARAQQLPELQARQTENIRKLNTIDRAKFDELTKEEADLEKDCAKFVAEQRELLQSQKTKDLENLKASVKGQRKSVADLADVFNRVKNDADISGWIEELDLQRSKVLNEIPEKDAAADRFNALFHDYDRNAAAAWENLKAQRRELAMVHSKFADLPVESENNESFARQLAKLEEGEIPEYAKKAERERKNWEGLFRTQILEKLQGALHSVRDLLSLLNHSLKQKPIGNNTYQLRYWQNPDFKLYHELVEASALARADELFFASAEPRFRDAIQHFLTTLTEEGNSVEAVRLLDYRHYYEYDMEVVEEDGRKTSVDRHSGKFSGGENQSPYFIAILASYLRAYRRFGGRRQEPSLGLVPIDEAFSKLSGERIKDCISALKAFDLQGVFSMSTGNIPYAFEHCDWLVVVSKEERRSGKRTHIRNIPVSLARDSEDARRLMDS